MISRFAEIQKNFYNIAEVFWKVWLFLHPYAEEWTDNTENQGEYKCWNIATHWKSIYEIRGEEYE